MGRLGAFVFAAALVASMLGLGLRVNAGPAWCEEDPVFVVNGAILDVTTSFPAEYVSSIKEPILFEIIVPKNVVATGLAVPAPIPQEVRVTHSNDYYWGIGSIPVTVKVTVKASKSFDTSTRVAGTYLTLVSTVWGKSNQTTTAKFYLLGL